MRQSLFLSIGYPTSAARSAYSETSHRRDIDGLRALAALSVVACHTVYKVVPGGGSGVDMFFVLSGFLISGIILRALVRETFSFSDFYARRIRRIFPALLVVLLTVWAIGSVLLLPDEYRRLGKDIATSAAFSLYIFWGLETNLPFDWDVGGNLLSQLWSLGVEEQFYLLWPLLLLSVYKFSKSNLVYVAVGVSSTAILSFILFVIDDRLPFGFSLVPWRGLHELSLGGLLAVVQLGDFPCIRNIVSRMKQIRLVPAWVFSVEFWSFIAAMLLIYSILIDPARQLFPNCRTLAPTFGTLLLISSASNSTIGRRIFGSSGMVFFGLISYPLYLWHLPVLFFLLALTWGHTPSPAETLILVLSISTALAFLTYKYIEVPVRSSPRRISTIAALCSVMFLCGLLGIATFNGSIHPVSYFTRGDLSLPSSEDWLLKSDATAWTQFQDKPLVLGRGRPSVLFMGDSSMQQYYPHVEKLLSNGITRYRSAVFLTRFGCVPGVDDGDTTWSGCRKYTLDTMAYASTSNINTVVISGCWYGYFSDITYFNELGERRPLKPFAEPALNNLRLMIGRLIRSGKHVYLILNIPVGAGLDPRARAYWYGKAPAPLNRSEVETALEPINSKLREIADEVGANVINPISYLCSPTQCPAVSDDGMSMYRDLWHLRPLYVRDKVTFLDGILESNSKSF